MTMQTISVSVLQKVNPLYRTWMTGTVVTVIGLSCKRWIISSPLRRFLQTSIQQLNLENSINSSLLWKEFLTNSQLIPTLLALKMTITLAISSRILSINNCGNLYLHFQCKLCKHINVVPKLESMYDFVEIPFSPFLIHTYSVVTISRIFPVNILIHDVQIIP